jgi:hypothetical protein
MRQMPGLRKVIKNQRDKLRWRSSGVGCWHADTRL